MLFLKPKAVLVVKRGKAMIAIPPLLGVQWSLFHAAVSCGLTTLAPFGNILWYSCSHTPRTVLFLISQSILGIKKNVGSIFSTCSFILSASATTPTTANLPISPILLHSPPPYRPARRL
ncbi:hypothetical protein P3342_011218 [Pyrenophora teres f. teres]|nr:hypothetical protein P3342_011218 [Pyrenophora teres f. teres]